MQLDCVLTLAIGRNYGDNVPLSNRRWNNFQCKLREVVSKQATVVGFSSGNGVGSDEGRNGEEEETAILVAINPKDVTVLRASVAQVIKHYQQSSAAFAIDNAHEPVFATKDGTRACTS